MRERVTVLDQQIEKLRGMRRYFLKKVAWIEAGEKGAPPVFNPEPGRRVTRSGC